MARKPTKKQQQEAERKARLKAGGQSIASAAQREVEKRNQESFNQRLRNAGITEQYSPSDSIARNAVREIEKRKNLSSFLQEQENKKNKAQQERTRTWQQFSRNATVAGHPELAYAAKQINDTGVSKEDQEKHGSSLAAKKAKLNEFMTTLTPKAPANREKEQKAAMGNSYDRFKQGRQDQILAGKEKLIDPGLPEKQEPKQPEKEEGTFRDWSYKRNIAGREKELDEEYARKQAERKKQNTTKRMTVGEYNNYLADLQKDIDKGIYNQGDDPYLMTDEGLENGISGKRAGAQRATEKADQMEADFERQRDKWAPDQKWGGIFDLVEGWDESNEEQILRGNYAPEYQANAENTLSQMRDSREGRRQETLERARDYFETFNQEMWARDWENEEWREGLRELMYDKIMPDKYAERTGRMTPEQKEQFDAAFDDMIAEATGTNMNWFDQEPEYNRLNEQAEALNGQADAMLAEQQRRRSKKNLEEVAGMYTSLSPEYDPSLVKTRQFLPDEWHSDTYYEPEGTDEDKAYYWANNVPEDLATVDPNRINKYYFIAADQDILYTFNKLYNKDHENPSVRSNLAEAYLNALEPYLDYCMSHYQDNWFREIAEDPVAGPVARVMSYPLNVVGGITGTLGTLGAALGVESAKDKNSPWYLTTKMVQTVRGQQNENLDSWAADVFGDWAKGKVNFLANVVDSIGDNLFAAGTAGGLSGGNYERTKNFIQAIMSMEATSGQMLQQLEDGKDPTEAAVYAVADGVIEWITEEKSIDKWLKPDVKAMLGDRKALTKYIRNAMLAEGSEEVNSDLLNMAVDYVMGKVNGHENELEEKYHKLVASGVEPEEARKQVLLGKTGEVALSGLAGSLSGGLMAGGRFVNTSISNKINGKSIKGRTINGQTGTEALLETAKNMPEGSVSEEKAAEIQEAMDAGKEISDRAVGELAQAIQIEAHEVLEKANSGEDVEPERIQKSIDALNSVTEITGQREATGKEEGDTSLQLATEDEISQAEGERIQGPSEVIHDGKIGRIVALVNEKVTGEDGETSTVQKYKVNIGGQDVLVDAAEIKATDKRTAAIIRDRAVNTGLYSVGYTNVLLQELGNSEGKSAEAYRAGATAIRLAAYTGRELPRTDLDPEMAQRLYDYSRDEFQALRDKETDAGNRNANRPGQGTATFKGAEYGTDAFKAQVKNLSKNQRNLMGAWAEVAKRAGIDLQFVDNEDIERLQAENSEFYKGSPDTMYGAENRSGIILNIEGMNYAYDAEQGKSVQTGRHDIGVAFGHEMAHWLQRNSRDGYDNLMSYIMGEQRKARGQAGLNSRLMEIMQKRNVDLAGAVSELVAESCDQILSNEEVIRHIEETNKGLYGEIRGFVKNLVARIRNAIGGMAESMSRDARAMVHANMKEVARLWNIAWDEAVSGNRKTETGETAAEEQDQTRHSQADEDTRRDLQGRAASHIRMNAQARNLIYQKYGIGENDIMFGIEFLDDGKVDWAAHDDAEKKLIRQITKQDLKELYKLSQDDEKWKKTYDDSARLDTEDYYENAKDVDRAMSGETPAWSVIPREIWAPQVTRYGRYTTLNQDAYADMDAQYMDAVNRGDFAAAEQMLMDKYQQMEKDGIIGYNASHFNVGDHAEIARKIKTGDPKAIRIAAEEMAKKVPDNAVLIPMPPHEGKVTEKTDTMLLAREIAKITGKPVVVALESDEHISRNVAKTKNIRGVTAESMGFRQAPEMRMFYYVNGEQVDEYVVPRIPLSSMPVFIDNMVGGGVTAKAAHDALGRGITLAYAQSSRTKIRGAKYLSVTYDEDKNPIPLSRRMDPESKSWKNSIAELPDGTKYLNLDTDQEIFDNATADQYPRIVEKYITDKYRGKVIGDVNRAYVDRRSAKEYAHPVKKNINADVFDAKARASTELENLMNVAAFQENVADDGRHPEAVGGWDRYTALIRVPGTNRIYEGTINIEKVAQGDRFHDMTHIKDVTSEMQGHNASLHTGDISKDNISQKITKSNTRLSSAEVDDRYFEAEKNGDEETMREIVESSAKKAGYTVHAFHGTGRADRVGTVFLPERATSGPMAFFTDNREIAENYSRNKIDTSIAYDEEYGDYYNQFRVTIKGQSMPVGKLWNTLSFAERQKITEAAKHITLDDETDEIIFDENAQNGVGNFNDYERKLHGWNSIDTLIDGWLEGGTLWNREGDFLKVLELAGIKNVTWNNPDAREEKVYDVFLKIQNPFDTEKMYNERFWKEATEWWEKQDHAKYERESAGADGWDKNSITMDEWLGDVLYDINNGYTHAWTRIPDAATDYLKSLGHDGIRDQGGKGGGESHTVWVPFSSEQVKSAETVTYDNSGKIIPPSQRFNDENIDIRYSQLEESADVNAWLAGQSISSFRSEDEVAMWQAWKDLRMSMQLSLHKQIGYRDQIRKMESQQTMDAESARQLEKLRDKLETEKAKLSRLEEEMRKITTDEGWAAVMRKSNMVISDFLAGKTQDQVQAAIDTMTDEIGRAGKDIAAQEKALAEMEKTSAVRTVKKLLNRGVQSRMTAEIRKKFNTAMSEDELKSRLAEMIIKSINNEDIMPDAEALAEDIITNQVGYGNEEAMEKLALYRGKTIEISPSQMKELKSVNMSLKEIREMTRGSGIRFVTGMTDTLQAENEDLIRENVSLKDIISNDKEALMSFARYIQGLLQSRRGENAEGLIDVTEVKASVLATVQLAMNEETGGMNRGDLALKIQAEAGRIAKALEAVRGVQSSVELIRQSNQKAQNWAGILKQDMDTAMDYYNRMAKLAAQQERKKVKEVLIQQLKSENTRKLIEQQQKFEDMMKSDRKARELAQDNLLLRNQIHTVTNRIKNRMMAETDQKNIPEEAKALARQVLNMIVDHDTAGWRKVTFGTKKQLADMQMRLAKMKAVYGEFDAERDLDWLVIKAQDAADNDYSARDKVWQDLMDIETGLLEYHNAEGRKNITLQDRKNALTKVQEAVSEIWDIINARSTAIINGRRMQVYELAEMMEDDMRESRFKGERTGKLGKAAEKGVAAIGYGNLTPEYFFKNLKNRAMTMLHHELHGAENRSGLEALKARARMAEIAKETGFNTWDAGEKHELRVAGGKTITITTEQLMSLYATWLRESNQMRPEETAHLLNGGFVLAKNAENGLYGREKENQRPVRMSAEQLEALGDMLTEQQKAYVDAVVEYLSNDMAELGNEASMKMFGIKKFTERYYFPIRSWGGVLNRRSDAGVRNNNENRSAQQGFSKRVRANAWNAIEIGDFTPTAVKHIAGMISYNTVGPAVENMNKVLNQQLEYGEKVYGNDGEVEEDSSYKRNMRAAFKEAYGTLAYDYLERFMGDVNGGVTRAQDKSIQERLLSVFRKGAVAGSLSVAAQQPLSFIRAAVMINPKYLAAAISPVHWGNVHKEMLKYSGVAVIKDMGRFDMNQGQSMVDYITPEGKESPIRKAAGKAVELTTILPEKMDALTWGRMWIACKLEQKAQNPDMDVKSDEFLTKVAERFNDVMRKTQVYDSVMVKSRNMRSTNYAIKAMTSFMAEPTLSLNVLADAVRNTKGKRGGRKLAMAAATFLLSAAMQAAVKAAMSSGRSPDRKKRWDEQFAIKWANTFMSEADPLTLIPGYSDLIEVFKNGELKDDAMSALGKFKTIGKTAISWVTGKSDDHYRNFEDTVGQLAQLFTNVPVKNLMRDGRAIYNFFNPDTYAGREYSAAVVKHGIREGFYTADNLIGVVNTYLEMADAGFGTSASEYYRRILSASAAGDKAKADELREFVSLGKGTKDKTIDDGIAKAIRESYESGELDRKKAEAEYKKLKPDIGSKDLMEQLDKVDWKKSGHSSENYSNYNPLYEAIGNNSSDEIRAVVKRMIDNGYKPDDIKRQLTTKYKSSYLEATGSEKTRIRDALTKAYKAIGLSANEALKIIDGWKKSKNSSKTTKTKNEESKDTTGRWGRGNIDLNNRRVVNNSDGSISTEESFSVNIDGKEVLLPTIINGKRVSEEEAIRHYEQTGEYLGKFNTVKEAEEYAEKLHNRQDWYYHK